MPEFNKSQPEFNKSQLDEIKKQAVRFWHESTQAHNEFFNKVSDRERMARSLLPQDLADLFAKMPDRSSLAPPDFYINIASLRAAICNLVFGSKPYGQLSVFGAKSSVDNPLVYKAESILQHMNDLAMVEQQADDVIHQALYAGVSCAITRWTKKSMRQFFPGIAGITEVPLVSFSESVPIDIRRVRIDPSIDKLKNRRIVGHHYLSHVSTLLKLNRDPNHFYDFDESDVKKSAFDREKYYEYVKNESVAFPKTGVENPDYGDKVVEVIEIRGQFRIPQGKDDYQFEDLIVHLANREHILGVKRNDLPIPGWEVYDFPTVDSELGRLFPMGVIEPAEDLWLYKFFKHNQALDRDNRDIYEMYLASRSAAQSLPEQLPYIPGGIITIDEIAAGIDDVRKAFTPMPKAYHSEHTIDHTLMLEQRIQQMNRLSDYIQGSDPTRAETATAVEALVQGGHNLLMHLIEKLKYSFFQPSWQKKLILWNFFAGYEKNTIPGAKGEPVNINPNEINLIWQIDIDTNANRDRPSMIRRFVEMYPMMMQNSYFDQEVVSRTAAQLLQLPNQGKLLRDNDYAEFIADRENAALIQGVWQPVHENDPHEIHIRTHSQASGDPLVDRHIADHQSRQANQNAGALGNTKELGGLEPDGSMNAAGKTRTGVGTGVKSEARR